MIISKNIEILMKKPQTQFDTLCLDLGLKTGWALWEPLQQKVTSGTIDFGKGRKFHTLGYEFVSFYNFIREKLKTLRLKENYAEIYFENVFAHKGTDAAHMFGGFRSTLYMAAYHHQVGTTGVPVPTIKKNATGTGKASKRLVMDKVKEAGYLPFDDNEADALAILLFNVPYPKFQNAK